MLKQHLRLPLIAVSILALGWFFGTDQGPLAPCDHTEERATDGWCASCGLGFVADVPIASKLVFDALDAHGHELERAALACDTCREAYTAGGFCEACNIGWVASQAYFSQLSFQIARGERDPRDDCPRCNELRGEHGWCATCEHGWIGNIRIADRGDFELGQAAYAGLLTALDDVERCELCAAARVARGVCPACRVSYQSGEAEALAPPR